MILTVIGTGSSGNSYLLQNTNTALILDAGVSISEVKKALHYNIKKVVGVLITHSHGDHSKFAREYLKIGIRCYAHRDTLKELDLLNNPFAIEVKPTKPLLIHEFAITPFDLQHDVTCLGFQITYPDCGNVIYITDTKFSKYSFSNVNNWIVECNYSNEILEERAISGKIDDRLYRRIKENHMSLETTIDLFKSNDLRFTNKIVLVHGSDGNSDSKLFKNKLQEEIGKPVYVANKYMELNLMNEL